MDPPLWAEIRTQDCLSDQTFIRWSNAWLEWKVKRVSLPRNVEVLLQYKLARYGMGCDVEGGKRGVVSDADWMAVAKRTKVILDAIRMRRGGHVDELLDNDFFVRMRLIHAEFVGLVDVEELRGIPVAEMVFCLAVFLLSFRDEATYGMFKLLLIPVDVVVFLRAVVSSILDVKSENGVKKYEKLFRKLRKCHSQVEQLYHLNGARLDVMAVYNYDNGSLISQATLPQTISRLERVLKCDHQLLPVLETLLLEVIEGHKKVAGAREEAERFYSKISCKLPLLKALLEIAIYLRIRISYQLFLSKLRQCHSLPQIRSLCRYIRNIRDISEYHKVLLEQVDELYVHLEKRADGEKQENVLKKINIIQDLRTKSLFTNTNKLSQFAFIDGSKSNFESIKHSLQLDLTPSIGRTTITSIHDLWSNVDHEIQLLQSTQVISPRVYELNIGDSAYFPGFSGSKAFFNILEKETISITKSIYFDSSIKEIKSILAQCDCSSIDRVLVNYENIPTCVIVKLSCYLRRCFDHLQKANLLLDDEELLKSGHEMLFGKLFYHFLCSDDPSYRAMVKDCNLCVVLGSLVLTEVPYESLCKRRLLVGSGDFKDIRVDGLEWVRIQNKLLKSFLDVDVERKSRLTNQGACVDGEFYYSLEEYGKVESLTLKEIVACHFYNSLFSNDTETIPFVKEILKELDNPELKVKEALLTKKYDVAFSYSNKCINSLEIDFYNWESLIDSLVQAGVDTSLWNQEELSEVMQKLIQHGNLQSIKSLLEFRLDYIPSDEILVKATESGCENVFYFLVNLRKGLGETVIFAGIGGLMNSAIEPHVLQMNEESLRKALSIAVRVNNLELVKLVAEHSEKFCSTLERILPEAIRMNRSKIVEVILDRLENIDLNSLLLTAATAKRWQIVKLLLGRGADPLARRSSTTEFKTALHIFVNARCLKVVKLVDLNSETVDKNGDLGLLTIAASNGSLKLMKYLLNRGFSVLNETNLFQEAWTTGNIKLRKLSMFCLIPLDWKTGVDSISTWHNLNQRLKFLPYFTLLADCHSFHQDEEMMQFVLRRGKLHQAVDAHWSIKEVEIASDNQQRIRLSDTQDKYIAFSKYFKDLECCLKSQEKRQETAKIFTREIHVFNSISRSYAFVELNLYERPRTTEFEIFNTDRPITMCMIRDELLSQLQKDAFISCSIRIFHEEKRVERFELLQSGLLECLVELQPIDDGSTLMEQNTISNLFPDITTESRLVLAMKSCDLASVDWLLNCVGKVEHEDVWLDPKLAFLLVDNPGILTSQKVTWLRKLHVFGMKLSVVDPDFGFSAIEYAQSKGFEELAERMIDWSCEGLTKQQQFMMIIQQCSVDVFKLYSRKLNCSPEELFISISNALQELNVKQVFISKELHMYLWSVLSDYGFNNLCTSQNDQNNARVLKTSKNTQSKNPKVDQTSDRKYCEKDKRLFHSIDLVIAVIRKLQSRTDREDVLAIDNEILFQFRMVHKHLFFVKDDGYFKNLPLRETVFLLAIFLSTFNDHVDWHESNSVYRIILNKPTLMSFLVFIAEKLNEFLIQNPNREFSEKCVFVLKLTKQDRKNQKLLLKLYLRVKQMYSLSKVHQILKHFNPDSNSKEITVASIKRFNQIFGECIKSTPKSQNLPSKLNQILNNQLCDYIRVIQKTRDVTCHDYPLGRKFLSLDDQFLYYSPTAKYLKMVKVTIAILMICTCHEYLSCLFGSLRMCYDLEKLRSLIRFFGNQSRIKAIQNECLNIIVKYHEELIQALNKVSSERLNPEEKKSYARLKANYDKRSQTVDYLKELINDSFYYDYDEIQIIAFSASTAEEVHRLLQINLISKNDIKILEFVEKNWEVLADDSYFLCNALDIPETGVGFMVTTLNRFEINQQIFHENYCQEEVQRIIKYLGVTEEKSTGTKLANSLKRYFNNIFMIDSKIQAIIQVFGKKTIAKVNDKLIRLRQQEIEELQNIILLKQRSIMSVFKQYNCSNIEQLIKNANNIPQNALLAIEYWLLELCEILITTRRFQDNFYSIKHDVQMICGRNFRNYLAHDGLSYNVLTCSPNVKVLINALVMADKEWDLFTEPKLGIVREIVDSSIAGERWLHEQKLLATAALNFDFSDVETAIKQGALPAGRFWITNGNYEGLTTLGISEMICLMNVPQLQNMDMKARNVLELVDPYFVAKWKLFLSSEIQLLMELRNSNFQSAISWKADNTWGQLIRSKLFSFPCLGSLLLYLEENEKYVEILNVLSNIESKCTKAALSVRSDVTNFHILKKMPSKLTEIQINAIIKNVPLETLIELIPNNSLQFVHLKYAIMSNNLAFFTHFLKNVATVKNILEVENAINMCARLGRLTMMKAFLESSNISKTALNYALVIAVQHAQWKTASYLQQAGGNPWHRVRFQEFNAGEMAIVMCNLKITETFLKDLPEQFMHHYLLSGAVKYGTVRMVKLLLRAGCDIWRNNKILLNVKDNKRDESMESFIQKTIFECKPKEKLDSKLVEWMRVMHEYVLVQNYKDFLIQFLCECNLAKKVFIKFLKLGKTDDGYSLCDIETCIMNTSYIDNLDTFTSIDHNIERQSPTGQPSKHKLHLEYQYNSTKLTCEVDLDIFNAKTELPNTLHSATECNVNPNPISISSDVISAIDTYTESSAIVGQFQFLEQQFRFLRLGGCYYIGELSPENIPNHIRSLFNSTNSDGETILHSVTPDTDVELLQILLSTGVDPTLLDSKGRTALLFMLNVRCSWQVLEFMLQYCFEKDVRNSEGIHIFDILDPQGCSLLSHAIAHGRSQVVERLLSLGVDQNIPNVLGKFPIHYAVLARNVSIVKALIANQPDDVSKQQENSKETPLFMAVKCNNGELTRVLLDAGSNMGLKNSQGETVVAVAIGMECNKALEVLLDHAKLKGIDVVSNITTENVGALQYAMIKDNVDTFKSVLEHMVGSRLDTSMTQDSLFRMKKVLLSVTDRTMNAFIEAQMLKKVQIHSYLESCEKLFKELTNESLREEEDKFCSETALTAELVEIDDLD